MLQLSSESDFAIARNFLCDQYSEEILTADLGVSSVFEFDSRETGRAVRVPMVRLFFAGAHLRDEELKAAMPDPVMSAIRALGLLVSGDTGHRCPVLLFPVRGMYVVCDRIPHAESNLVLTDIPKDIVYLALTKKTRSYLTMLPETPCDAFLDIGAGSGVAAVLQARYAQQVCASDISARSALFADFSARLNGLTNFRSVQGSLYDPVAGLTFDRIGCHPPYDTTLGSQWTFCDGGYDGEFVLKGSVQGLPAHLRKGGRFYAQVMAGDRAGKPFEYRLREWLGNSHHEFDIAIVVRDTLQPQEYAFGMVMTTSKTLEDFETYMERFRSYELEQLVYCNILIERKTAASEPLTLRRQLGDRLTAHELEWLVESQRDLPALTFEGWMPAVSPHFELRVRHGMQSGELRPVEYTLHTSSPFTDDVSCPEWIARLVAACNGKHTAAEIYEHLRKRDAIQPADFDAALKRLFALGAINRTQAP